LVPKIAHMTTPHKSFWPNLLQSVVWHKHGSKCFSNEVMSISKERSPALGSVSRRCSWRGMTACACARSCVWHMTHSHVWNDSSMCVARPSHVWRDASTRWLIHVSGMTHPHVWHEAYPCVWHDWVICVAKRVICVTWLIHMSDRVFAQQRHGRGKGYVCVAALQHVATHSNRTQHTVTHIAPHARKDMCVRVLQSGAVYP